MNDRYDSDHRHFSMSSLDEHGRPKITSPIKCRKCGMEFLDIVNFNMHKSIHKQYRIT